jgi:hypothetical protein
LRGFAARIAKKFSNAFGESDGFRHGAHSLEKGQAL